MSPNVTPPKIDPLQLRPGAQIGAYRVVRRLGTGGMGTAILVERDGELLVAKLPLQDLAELNEDQRIQAEHRLEREFSNLLLFKGHPNIVGGVELFRWPTLKGFLVIVTEYVGGLSVMEWQQAKKPSVRQLGTMAMHIARGLEEMHRRQIVHRDIKSDNVLIEENNNPVLLDLGISRGRLSRTVTSAGLFCGSIDHMSPEQCATLLAPVERAFSPDPKVRADADPAADGEYEPQPPDDLYALGVVLYRCLTGTLPHVNDNEMHLMMAIAREPHRPVVEVAPSVPAGFAAIVEQLLVKDPAQRFASNAQGQAASPAANLAAVLEEALQKADASWDAPYEPPPRVDSTTRSTTGGQRRSRRQTPAVNAGDLLDELLGESSPELAPPVVDAAQEASAPAAAPTGAIAGGPPPAMRHVTDVRRGFVELEAPAVARAQGPDGSQPRLSLPSSVRAVAALQDLGATPRRKSLVLAGIGVAAVGVLLVGGLVTTPIPQPKSLLGDFERARSAELARASGGSTPPPADDPTTLPPAAGLKPKAPAVVQQSLVPQPAAATPPQATPDAPQPAPAGDPPVTMVRGPSRTSPQPRVPPGPRSVVLAAAPAPQRGMAETAAARAIPAGVRCKVELRRDVQANADRGAPVEVTFRLPCYRHGETEVVPESSSAFGTAVAKNGRVMITFDGLRFVGDLEPVKVAAVALQGGQLGVPGVPSLSAPPAPGANVVQAAGRIAETAVLSQLPGAARELVQSASSPTQGAPRQEALGVLSLARGTEFFVSFKESP